MQREKLESRRKTSNSDQWESVSSNGLSMATAPVCSLDPRMSHQNVDLKQIDFQFSLQKK